MTQHSSAEKIHTGHSSACRPIRIRSILLGVTLALAICAITPFNNVYRQATPLGGGHFPLAPFFVLIWLTIIIAIVQKIAHRNWLTGRELLVAWILMVLASGIAYTGLTRTFFINLTAPYHFATVENRWEEMLHPLLPELWYPQDLAAIENLYNGLAGGRQMGWMQVLKQIPWHVWMTPLVVWGIFIFLCYFVMVCIVNMLSSQPLYNERMNFPLLQVPELMKDALDEKELWRFLSNRFLLAGILVPVFLHLLNGLNFYFPVVPRIPTLILAGHYFPKHGLFSGFYKLKIYIYPAFIGFAFLATKQISFSFWFFFVLGGLLVGLLGVLGYNIPSAALGITFGPTLSRPDEAQMIGAYGIFFIFLFWLARHHFARVLQMGVAFRSGNLSDAEWFPIRVSFWGFVAGGLGIVIWCRYFGLPFFFSFLVVGAFFMVTLVAMRVICQGGIAYFTLTAAPIDGLLAFFGPKAFTNIGILVAAVAQKVLFVDLRESLMPSLLHASKTTQGVVNRKMILSGIAVTLFGAVAVSFLAMLTLCYKFGIRELGLDWATRTTVAVYDNIFNLVETPVKPGRWVLIFIAAGALVMTALSICYHRFYWWPIHPIGYLTAYSSAMQKLWFAFFVGWLCNALCMRYGGVALFKRLRYFFMGLIIGDFLMGGIWAVVGIFSFASYQVLPT
ncbi:MAG: hypothetical protein JRH18_18660 [Deltaproteobacteria bacterium]|nr:hypothetical protein [Deltaproteobacteria bacterium]MBW2153678.1 hypothetical protein [Deltaproteobacteria bacterium]